MIVSTWWEARRQELVTSIWILVMTGLAMAAIIILTNGERILPIAGGCIVGVFLVYELVQYDLHMQKKGRS